MGAAGLNEFIDYLDNRLAVLDVVEKQLCDLQGKYEAYFGEITRVREQEFDQLRGHVEDDRDALPGWFADKLTAAQRTVEKEYQTKLDTLEAEIAEMTARAEKLRRKSAKDESNARGRNRALDGQEEALKARNEQLLAAIADYNEQIRSLGGGFGFFVSLFRLRKLAKDKIRLDEEQADVAARIDALRARWTEEAKGYVDQEHTYRNEWLELETESAAHRTKRDYLVSARARIVVRSALEQVLYELAKEPAKTGRDGPKCPRCSTPNAKANHFCHICAQRLAADRPDLEGSIHEMAELNHHFQRFSDGMRSCQEIIGLVRGLHSGVEAFKKSVVDVKSSETKHSLSKLSIDVPGSSVAYGQQFDALAQSLANDWSLHPAVLAERAHKLVTDVFTEDRIKAYFETMGEELSTQADSQW
jgi:DNA repair exonuclease SbcCD ATPase subunit